MRLRDILCFHFMCAMLSPIYSIFLSGPMVHLFKNDIKNSDYSCAVCLVSTDFALGHDGTLERFLSLTTEFFQFVKDVCATDEGHVYTSLPLGVRSDFNIEGLRFFRELSEERSNG